MSERTPFPAVERSVATILNRLQGYQRVLFFGPPGIGKSTLAAEFAAALAQLDQPFTCISGDPGSPAFGIPGAVSLGRWTTAGWECVDFEPLCTLDAGRFRLPLIQALDRLSKRAPAGLLLVDAAGVTRGAAGAEMLISMVESLKIDCVSCAGVSRRRTGPRRRTSCAGDSCLQGTCSAGGAAARQESAGPAPHGPVERISRERYRTRYRSGPPSPASERRRSPLPHGWGGRSLCFVAIAARHSVKSFGSKRAFCVRSSVAILAGQRHCWCATPSVMRAIYSVRPSSPARPQASRFRRM